MDFNSEHFVYLHMCKYIFLKDKQKQPLLRNAFLTTKFLNGKKAGVLPKKFLLEHLR